MVKIIWTDNAIKDLADIGEYIEKDSPKYAELTVTRLFETPTILINYPQAGKIVPEFDSQSIRELINGNYHIVYRVVNYEEIDILTVHHCSRLIRNALSFDNEKDIT